METNIFLFNSNKIFNKCKMDRPEETLQNAQVDCIKCIDSHGASPTEKTGYFKLKKIAVFYVRHTLDSGGNFTI